MYFLGCIFPSKGVFMLERLIELAKLGDLGACKQGISESLRRSDPSSARQFMYYHHKLRPNSTRWYHYTPNYISKTPGSLIRTSLFSKYNNRWVNPVLQNFCSNGNRVNTSLVNAFIGNGVQEIPLNINIELFFSFIFDLRKLLSPEELEEGNVFWMNPEEYAYYIYQYDYRQALYTLSQVSYSTKNLLPYAIAMFNRHLDHLVIKFDKRQLVEISSELFLDYLLLDKSYPEEVLKWKSKLYELNYLITHKTAKGKEHGNV
jgi:hypothetical protein